MAHLKCICDASMWDGDLHIVYDVFSFKDLRDYIFNDDTKTFDDIYEENPPFYEDPIYFWLCDNCKTIHLWNGENDDCYRRFKLKTEIDNLSIDEIKKLNEYLVINLNEYTNEFAMTPIKDLLIRNPINPYKYFITDDLINVYVINIDENKIVMQYELIYESFVKYSEKIETYEDLLISTIDKKNNGHEYIIENGIRIQSDKNDYPHKQVDFMITEGEMGISSISYPDPNKEPEIYTIHTMKKFYEKYGKYLQDKGSEENGK